MTVKFSSVSDSSARRSSCCYFKASVVCNKINYELHYVEINVWFYDIMDKCNYYYYDTVRSCHVQLSVFMRSPFILLMFW